MKQFRIRHPMSMLTVILLAATFLSGCTAATPRPTLAMASMDGMPMAVQSASAPIREAYQFAAANQPILEHIPCYCGCDKMGHASNYDCYIAPEDSEGSRTYDLHAVNCAICINITHDVMRLTQEGQPLGQIRSDIDQTYSKYGLSTKTK